MTSAAESITESLRRTRQLMVQVGCGVLKMLSFFSDMIFQIDGLMQLLVCFRSFYRRLKELQAHW